MELDQIVSLCRDIFAAQGLEVETVPFSSAEALQQAVGGKRTAFDLYLLDIEMKEGASGLDVARQLLDKILTAADDAEKAELQATVAGRMSYKTTDVQYALENQIAVSTSVANDAASYFEESAVAMVGGTLNVEPPSSEVEPTNRTVVLQVSGPDPTPDLTEHAHELSFDLSLLVDNIQQHGELNFPVKVTLPVPTGYDPGTVALYHQEDGTLTKVDIEKNTDNGTVTFTTTSFSTYVFAQDSAPDLPDDDPTTGGDPGEDQPPYIPSVPSYQIGIPDFAHGTVTTDRAAARQGATVTLTVTPEDGYTLDEISVTDFFGNQVDISRNSDGTYSFVMPASQVTVSAAFVPAQLPFTDVTEANWYYDEVYYVWANGLMQGTSATTFGPNVDTTRAMVVTILWRLEGEPASGYDMDYSDVAGGAWYAGAVRWATEHGIVNGSEGQFYPGGIVTREQLAAMLYRYAQYKGYDLTAGGDLSGFADADAVSGWAETSLAWAVGQGLLQGSDSQVDPQGSAIRAQTAAILMRFRENVVR